MFSEDVAGLVEDVRFQPSSELSSTDGCWAEVDREGIPDDWCCNVEVPPTELSSGPWHNHVTTLSRAEVWPARDVSHRNADIREVRWTRAADKVKSSKCYLELYSLRHRQPVKDITKDWSDVVKLAGTNNQTCGGLYQSRHSIASA